MSPIHEVIFALGLLLEVVILWRGLQAGLGRQYPFFYVYLSYVFIRTTILFVLAELQFSSYAVAYWVSDAAAVFLWFCITWEVFRQIFGFAPALRRLVGQVLIFLLLALTTALLLVNKSSGSIFADLERKSGLAQAVLLLTILFLARYYAIPLGRNVWGMALGFGMYVAVSIMNFAAVVLMESFIPYWRFSRPLSFIGMLGVWTWALWSYAPNPRPATAALEVYERGLAHWAQAWSGVRAALRKAVGL